MHSLNIPAGSLLSGHLRVAIMALVSVVQLPAQVGDVRTERAFGDVHRTEVDSDAYAYKAAYTSGLKSSSWRSRYTLGPGDVLNFGLYKKPDLFKELVPIGPDGRVTYLQAKRIVATGKTIDDLREEMSGALAKFYRGARVVITPAKLGSKRYTILGQVKKNGSFVLDQPLTLTQVIARSKGISVGSTGSNVSSQINPSSYNNEIVELADFKRSFVIRNRERLPVDMEKLYLRGDISEDIYVEPGDYIYVASKLSNEFYVFGAVNEPGFVPVSNHLNVIGAITEAGGFAQKAWKHQVLVVRGSLGKPKTFALNLQDLIMGGKQTDLELEPGDIVYVHNRPWSIAEDILDVAIKAFLEGATSAALAEAGVGIAIGL